MVRIAPRHPVRLVIMLVLLGLMGVASLSPDAWALPSQDALRQTVPTRTPVPPTKKPGDGGGGGQQPPPPTNTPVPPTSTPTNTLVPPTNTPKPPTATLTRTPPATPTTPTRTPTPSRTATAAMPRCAAARGRAPCLRCACRCRLSPFGNSACQHCNLAAILA